MLEWKYVKTVNHHIYNLHTYTRPIYNGQRFKVTQPLLEKTLWMIICVVYPIEMQYFLKMYLNFHYM